LAPQDAVLDHRATAAHRNRGDRCSAKAGKKIKKARWISNRLKTDFGFSAKAGVARMLA